MNTHRRIIKRYVGCHAQVFQPFYGRGRSPSAVQLPVHATIQRVPRVSVYLGRFEAAFNPVNKYGDVWIFVVFPPGNRLDLIADFRHMDEL